MGIGGKGLPVVSLTCGSWACGTRFVTAVWKSLRLPARPALACWKLASWASDGIMGEKNAGRNAVAFQLMSFSGERRLLGTGLLVQYPDQESGFILPVS